MVKEDQIYKPSERHAFVSVLVLFVLAACAVAICAQPAPKTSEAMDQRLARARALAAAHDLKSAAFELDAIRNSTTDDVIRDVARIMLMGIYLEEADYARAQVLLDEIHRARTRQDEGSCRSYFAVAGRAVNGVRAHLERFRALGLNIANRELPVEAVNDLDRVRDLLEHVADQARSIGAEDNKNTDAFALLEDIANVRSSLARNSEERLRWQGEVASAREHLTASETRIASLGSGGATNGNSVVLKQTNNSRASVPANLEARIKEPTTPATREKEIKSAPSVDSHDLSSSPATGGQVNVGSLIDQAITRVNPSYPAFAKTAHVTGIVRVEIVIDEKGSVVSAKSSTGPSVLRQSAIDAAKRWKFRPALSDGRPVSAAGYLNFNFASQ